MGFRRLVALALVSAVLSAYSFSARAIAPPHPTDSFGCDSPTTDAIETVPFLQQDINNQMCAWQRNDDQGSNPAFWDKLRTVAPGAYAAGWSSQIGEPSRIRFNHEQFIPLTTVGDPFRTAADWQAQGRGRVMPISFIHTPVATVDPLHPTGAGARLSGEIWLPPTSTVGPYPGVIIATGTRQQFRHLFNWLAQGLAESGYQVMTFDYQGQGGSETFVHNNNDAAQCIDRASCWQSAYPSSESFAFGPYYEQVKEAITFFFSTPSSRYSTPTSGMNHNNTSRFNPAYGDLDRAKVGLVGHSVGAIAVTEAGQEDTKIKAIVRYGYTGRIGEQGNNGIQSTAITNSHAPTLIMPSEYPEAPQPFVRQQAPGSLEHGYRQIRCDPNDTEEYNRLNPCTNLDVMQVAMRASTHYDWVAYPGRPASRYGERVAFYYTLAWLDAYLKGNDINDPVRLSAWRRLTAHTFDNSADASSIGSGTWDSVVGNQPYKIDGLSIPNRLSYQYRSMYWLQGGGLTCDDMKRPNPINNPCVPFT